MVSARNALFGIYFLVQVFLQVSANPLLSEGSLPKRRLLQNYSEIPGSHIYDIVIVGGGIAGLTALDTLMKSGFTNVVLLEAQGRLGGRIHTIREGGILVEEGAEWIHGEDKNPLYKIAKETGNLGEASQKGDAKRLWGIFDQDGNEINETCGYDVVSDILEEPYLYKNALERYYGKSYGDFYMERFSEKYGPDAFNSDKGIGWFHFLQASVASDEGSFYWFNMSTNDKDNNADFGDDNNWNNGYDFIISYLSENSSSAIRMSTPATHIYWDSHPTNGGESLVFVSTPSGILTARHALVTTSLAFLKENCHCFFSPSLPDQLTENYKFINLPSAEKIFIGWDKPWWGEESLEIELIWMKKVLPREMEWLYGIFNLHNVFNHKNVLGIHLAEPFASYMRDLPEAKVLNHVMRLIRKIAGFPVEQPSFFKRTQWKNNPWILESYSSSVSPEGERKGIDSRYPFRIPIKASNGKKVLFWAGEYTHDTRYSTTDGAYSSGLREAKRLINILSHQP